VQVKANSFSYLEMRASKGRPAIASLSRLSSPPFDVARRGWLFGGGQELMGLRQLGQLECQTKEACLLDWPVRLPFRTDVWQ
jgi:hypothetical protein